MKTLKELERLRQDLIEERRDVYVECLDTKKYTWRKNFRADAWGYYKEFCGSTYGYCIDVPTCYINFLTARITNTNLKIGRIKNKQIKEN